MREDGIGVEELEDSDEFEVEKILGKRINSGKTEYLIRWMGYKEEDYT